MDAFCMAPGEAYLCGYCAPPVTSCSTDTDCTPGHVCETFQCDGYVCQPGRYCVSGCTTGAGCSTGQSCGLDHHCAPTACTSDSQCAPNFGCDGASCARRNCSTDAECAGVCIDDAPGGSSACWPDLGVCSPPPA